MRFARFRALTHQRYKRYNEYQVNCRNEVRPTQGIDTLTHPCIIKIFMSRGELREEETAF